LPQLNSHSKGMNRPPHRRNYIGICCTLHDSAICVVNSSGDVVFAEAAERHLQSKRAFANVADDPVFIERVLQEYCERDAEIVAAKNWSAKSLVLFQVGEFLRSAVNAVVPVRHRLSPHLDTVRYVLRCQLGTSSVASESLRYKLSYPHSPLIYNGRRLQLKHFDHHLTHAAAGCYTSPFDDAVCAVVDAYGEGSSSACYHFKEGKLRPIPDSKSPFASLGYFYALICFACGFDSFKGEEWKVMGIAPYGKFNHELYDKLSRMLYVDGLRIRTRGMSIDKFWLEDHRSHAMDLAHTGQVVFEELLEQLLTNLANLGISRNLVYMGGCALNSTANGKIVSRTPFERLHIYSAPADDGTALGAALLAYFQDHPYRPLKGRPFTPYLGAEMPPYVLGHLAKFNESSPGFKKCGAQVVREAARLLAEGKIIGWVQGKAEFGPRALGNRSILASPCHAGIKDIINSRVKFREEFRPFAPSILHEYGDEYFENYEESPYMERTLRFRDDAVHKVPGVVHVDQSGRLQTVKREWNARYYDLIDEFRKLTGVPILLNTSFNVMGKPIVNSAEDAAGMLYTTGLDGVVIHDFIIEAARGTNNRLRNPMDIKAAAQAGSYWADFDPEYPACNFQQRLSWGF
jgi:carbamoyltransferase